MGSRLHTLCPCLAALALCGCTENARPRGGQADGIARTSVAMAVMTSDRAGEPHVCRAASEEQRAGTARDVPFVRNDTLFFCDYSRRDSTTGLRDYCRVFVDKNRLSANYERMRAAASLDSERNRRDFGELAAALREKYPGAIRRFDRRGCPEAWQRLASVEGEYYIDERMAYPIRITDSLFVEQMQDGPWPSLIESFGNPAHGHYTFRTRTLHGETRRFDLFVIDTQRSVGVLVEHSGAEKQYTLLAAGEVSPHFDLLVWESAEMPSGNEIPYDDIDFEALTSHRATTAVEVQTE